ncbi:MAG: Ig-like domain-containing protein, partial [Myxococcota bacterium]
MRPTQWIGLGSVCGMMVVVTASPSLAQEGEFRRRLNVYTAPDARMLATSYQGQSPEVTDAHVMVSSGAAVQFRLVGDDPDGDGLQFAIVDNPQHGVVEAFDAVTGQVTYRSNRDWVGEDLLRFVATDGHWTSDVGTVVIHVSAPDAAPYFIEPTPLEGARIDGQEGSVVRVELAAIDPDGDPVVFEANGLPTGAALDAETGVLTWFPEDWQAVGDHCMTVTAVAGRRADARSFCLRIRPIDDDNDGAPDSWERHVGLSDQHPDSDGDTLSDGTEMFDIRVGGVDTDEDGVIDALDDDSDGDGLLDRIEAGEGGPFAAPLDTDRDGIPDFRDRDSDQDGIDDADDHCPRQRAPTANGCFRQDGEGTPPPEAPNMVAPEDGAVQ